MSRTNGLLRLELSSDPEMLGVVRSAVMRLCEGLGFSEADCRGVTRATDEALANIIRHAYGGRSGQPIEMTCRQMRERAGQRRTGLEIVMVDRGTPADRKKMCSRPLDEIRPGGLGIHLIQEGVDVMQYKTQGHRNRLRLVKYLPTARSKEETAKGEKGENFNPANG